MIGLKMAWVCGEMKEGSGLFSCWLEELGWREWRKEGKKKRENERRKKNRIEKKFVVELG